ncbi:3897_t:CDS:2, partial [Dentiscutata heterogama]
NDCRILCQSLDTILYTTFKNTNELTLTVPLSAKSSNNCYNNISSPEIDKSSIENNNDENNINLDVTIVDQGKDTNTEPDFAGDNTKVVISDPV